MTNDIVITRKLGPGENFFRSRTAADFYRNFFTVGAYSNALTEDFPLFFRALRKTILDYHILICNVFKDHDAGYSLFRPIAEATIGDLVEYSDELFSPQHKPVSEAFMKKLSKTKYFDLYVEKPLFRIIMAGTHDMGVTFEHTMADGLVAPFFHEIFLENLATCQDVAAFEAQYGPSPTKVDENTVVFNYAADKKYIRNSLPPPVEMCMQDVNVDYTDNDPNHYSKVIPEGYPDKWPGRFPSTRDYSVAYKLLNIPPADMKVILKKCKEHGVTLTAYVVCNQALALAPIYGNLHHTLVMVAVTMRRFITPDNVDPEYKDIISKPNYKILGNYAHMGLTERLPPVKEFTWDLVKKVSAHLAQTVSNDKLLNTSKAMYASMHDLDDNDHLFTPHLGKPKGDSLKMSNLGYINFPVYDIPGKEPWTVNDVTFAQDFAPGASEFVINLISSPRGGLNLVLSYFDHKFDDTEYENFDEFPLRLRECLLENAGVSHGESSSSHI